jgi:G3E family GTPase
MLIEGDDGKPWARDEQRDSKLVFIGRDLDEAALKSSFAACVA